MRHRVFGRKLNRTVKERKALIKNLILSLVIHEEIKTTESKAKAIRGVIDKVIARGKQRTLHARRMIESFLQDKVAVNKIVDELGPRFKDRVSGFTRIIRLGERRGDNAMIVKMEFTERPKKEEEKKEGNDRKTVKDRESVGQTPRNQKISSKKETESTRRENK